VDHLGRPLAGVEVLARYQNAARIRQRLPPLLRKAKTDADGRFTIPAHIGFWRVQVLGRFENGALTAGRILSDGATLTREGSPDLAVQLEVYELKKLPRPLLYLKQFQRDGVRYLEHLRKHYSKARLAAALLVPPAEG
ncbi:MAG: DUF4198 domain-containing protein, partial [Planctomycetota bacterium]|nr:DUF4198 domain-containing protein [Planctomycetota bacterium]